MAFAEVQDRVATSIGFVRVYLETVDDEMDPGTLKETARYEVSILDQNGDRINVHHASGDLIPHITSEQRQVLQDFMAELRAQAEDQFLPDAPV
jgi:hypothetical protein